ncbi:MAG: hypothetical protein M1820_003087 [Bogoriella megaspora]|nr:MAG: hypothetical protein M1820_003087 [Bogoriella megaspora]
MSVQVLDDVKICLRRFQRNIRDAHRAYENAGANREALQTRLLPLLKCIIEQYIRLFAEFCHRVQTQNVSANGVLDSGVRDAVSSFRSVERDVRDDMRVWNVTTELRQIKDRWIRRSPHEITFLIMLVSKLRPLKEEDRKKPRVEREIEFLRGCIEEIRSENWESLQLEELKQLNQLKPKPRYTLGRPPPLVPKVTCLDATAQRIAATRPTWPGKSEDHPPWKKFLTASRDAQIQGKVREYYLNPASAKLTELKDDMFGEVKGPLPFEKWNRLATKFEKVPGYPFRQLELHVWQAIDLKGKPKEQCGRCRCYYKVNLANANTSDGSSVDTEHNEREAGPCAESILFSMHFEYLDESRLLARPVRKLLQRHRKWANKGKEGKGGRRHANGREGRRQEKPEERGWRKGEVVEEEEEEGKGERWRWNRRRWNGLKEKGRQKGKGRSLRKGKQEKIEIDWGN